MLIFPRSQEFNYITSFGISAELLIFMEAVNYYIDYKVYLEVQHFQQPSLDKSCAEIIILSILLFKKCINFISAIQLYARENGVRNLISARTGLTLLPSLSCEHFNIFYFFSKLLLLKLSNYKLLKHFLVTAVLILGTLFS